MKQHEVFDTPMGDSPELVKKILGESAPKSTLRKFKVCSGKDEIIVESDMMIIKGDVVTFTINSEIKSDKSDHTYFNFDTIAAFKDWDYALEIYD